LDHKHNVNRVLTRSVCFPQDEDCDIAEELLLETDGRGGAKSVLNNIESIDARIFTNRIKRNFDFNDYKKSTNSSKPKVLAVKTGK
jgi:hypothetical protein